MRVEKIPHPEKPGEVMDHYVFGPDEHAVVTGDHVHHEVTMNDGTVYDLRPPVIGIDPKHHDELHDAIGAHFEEHGHPAFQPGEAFSYAGINRATQEG